MFGRSNDGVPIRSFDSDGVNFHCDHGALCMTIHAHTDLRGEGKRESVCVCVREKECEMDN